MSLVSYRLWAVVGIVFVIFFVSLASITEATISIGGGAAGGTGDNESFNQTLTDWLYLNQSEGDFLFLNASEAGDLFVNRTGDTMQGNIQMADYNITNATSITADTINTSSINNDLSITLTSESVGVNAEGMILLYTPLIGTANEAFIYDGDAINYIQLSDASHEMNLWAGTINMIGDVEVTGDTTTDRILGTQWCSELYDFCIHPLNSAFAHLRNKANTAYKGMAVSGFYIANSPGYLEGTYGMFELRNGTNKVQHKLGLLPGKPVIWNEEGVDIDFRIESDTLPNIFMVDASTDKLILNVSLESQTATSSYLCIDGDGHIFKNDTGC